MNFVLDASVALSWCFADEGGRYAVDVLESLGTGEAVAASIWPLEVANGLVTAIRRERIAPAEAKRFATQLLALPIAIDPVSRRGAFEAVLELSRLQGLSAYDAAYLEVAIRLGAPIATLDRHLRKAAKKEGVPLYEP